MSGCLLAPELKALLKKELEVKRRKRNLMVDIFHIYQVTEQQSLSDQRIPQAIFYQLSLCFTSSARILEVGLRECYLILQNIVRKQKRLHRGG